ncbi:MAG: ferredoxin [Candidatus Aenigmarchaeota archaeon]|nr:ferredoxin [Candidatus Aenigmarchaeota archaeon]
MPKIIHELEKCIGCGACAAVCSDFFELGNDGKAHLKGSKKTSKNEELTVKDVKCAKDAEGTCPVQCIHVK